MPETKHVMIVQSMHTEIGHATRELAWLLGQLQPDVLFLEHSPDRHSSFLDGSWPTVESTAVRRYRDKQPLVRLVPVDLRIDAVELKQKFNDMFDAIAKASPRYCQLQFAYTLQTEKYGFAFLNSNESLTLQMETQNEMRATVSTVADASLSVLFALWSRMHDERESAMIAEIEGFAKHNAFDKAALLIGAAHGPTLCERLRRRDDANDQIHWDFDWQGEIANGMVP